MLIKQSPMQGVQRDPTIPSLQSQVLVDVYSCLPIQCIERKKIGVRIGPERREVIRYYKQNS